MTDETLRKLSDQGYRVFQSKDYFIVRRKVYTSLGMLFLFGVLGLLSLAIGAFVGIITNKIASLFMIVLGFILIIVPFFNFLTAAYRSLIIDFNMQSILFRSGYSRAYRFSELTDVKLEVQTRYADTNSFSDSNKEYQYMITAYFGNQSKEEVFSLTFRESDNEKFMFDLKDYFETLLKVRK